MKKGKQMKGKICIVVQNFMQLPETRYTQQICWHTFICCVHSLLHPELK